jgi:glucokinase
MSQPRALGIDVGGTTIKSATVDTAGRTGEVHRTPTPRDDPTGERTVEAIAGLVARQAAGQELAAIGLAAPGIVDEEAGTVISAVNLGWSGLPLRRLVEDRVGHPLAFGQDVRTGALAEASLGAARDHPVSVFLPIGTGVSIAVTVGGKALASGGWAGEIGQLLVRTAGGEGVRLESIASASAIAAVSGCASAEDAASLVERGDPRATSAWNAAVEALADAIAWTTAVVGADAVVIGGGLGEAGALLLEPLGRAVDRRLGALRRPALVPAAFGELATTVGAGLLAHRMR